MSKSVNKVILLGNIGQAPETKTLGNGTMLTTASLATNERKKVPNTDKWEDHTEWHSLVFFGRTAEIARDYLRKGSKCYVEGHLRTTSWEDDHQVKRWKTTVIIDELTLLDGKDSNSSKMPDEAYSEAF
jgi:single-strand DNA-binding protein